jgi:hypothetical protein
MTLDDIPKLNRVGEESGSVPRHRANATISHSAPCSVTVEEPLSDNRSAGVVVLASHAKSFQLALDQEFAKGVERPATSRAQPDLRCAQKYQ